MKVKIIFILSLAIFLRVIVNWPVLAEPSKAIHNDSLYHILISDNLIAGNGFSSCSNSPYYKNTVITPGYPILLATLKFIFGNDLRIIVGFQFLLDLATCFLIFLIGKNFSEKRVGLFASFLFAISPHAISYSSFIITETLFTFLVTLLIYIFSIKSLKNRFIYLAIIWPIMVFVRPISIYLLPIIIGLLILRERKNRAHLKALFMLVIGVVILLPWTVRNHKLTNVWTISSIKEYNLLFTYANSLVAKDKGIYETESRVFLQQELGSPLFSDCQGDYDYVSKMKNKGWHIISDRILEYTLVHLSSVPNMFLPEVTHISDRWNLTSSNKGTLAVIKKDGLISGFQHFYSGNKSGLFVAIPLILIWLLTLILSFFGFLRLIPNRWSFQFLLFVSISCYFIFIPGPASNGRFLLPVIPIICLFAEYGLKYLTKKP